MKPPTLSCLFCVLVTASVQAGPAESAIVAAMKLPDAPNYSWSTNVDDDARSYSIEGQTDRATDLSLVTMPVVVTMRRRVGTGTSNSGNVSTVAFKGDEQFAVETDQGWKTQRELEAMVPSSGRGGSGGGYSGGMTGMRGRGRRGMMGGMGGGGFPSPSGSGGDSARGGQMPAYSNLQKTLSRPHEEIAIIVVGASDLKMDGDVLTGTLSDTAAKLLLVHAGQKEITPLLASGTFRFWVQDGVLTRYEVKLNGRLAVITNGSRREVEVHQTATTDLRNLATTTFDLPDEAKKKLDVAADSLAPGAKTSSA